MVSDSTVLNSARGYAYPRGPTWVEISYVIARNQEKSQLEIRNQITFPAVGVRILP